MNYPKTDKELFEMMKKELYSAVVGDILDQMGRQHQFLPAEVRPLQPDMVVCGRAMTVLERDLNGARPQRAFGRMLEALDDLRAGEVYLCAGASLDYALVGEIMCTRMQVLGGAGAVCDGYHRDTKGILALDFPCFSRGSYSQDQAPRGQVIDFRVPLEIGAVRVEPGNLVFGDLDGVLVIPGDVEREVIERSWEKANGEKTVHNAIRRGMSATEAFSQYGIM